MSLFRRDCCIEYHICRQASQYLLHVGWQVKMVIEEILTDVAESVLCVALLQTFQGVSRGIVHHCIIPAKHAHTVEFSMLSGLLPYRNSPWNIVSVYTASGP